MLALWFLISSLSVVPSAFTSSSTFVVDDLHLRLVLFTLLLRKKGMKEFKYRWNDSFRGEDFETARKSIVEDYNRAG